MIMQTLARSLDRFKKSRRGAVAVIFAIALVPLVLMVGLAIDFSFFAEARSQVQLAADAAATHAIRAAAGTYALEINSKSPTYTVTQATSDAEAAGVTAGDDWFTAQIGALPTAYIPGAGGNTNPNVTVTPTTAPAGFTANVVYTGNYPPFFDKLFKSSAIWAISGTSKAAAQYSYVEIMMMLDTSQSMLIGSNAADIIALSKYSACTSPTLITTVAAQGPLVAAHNTTFINTYEGNAAQFYPTEQTDGDAVDFSNLFEYTNPSGGVDDETGSCKTGYKQTSLNNAQNTGDIAAPCAFACHNSTNTATFPDGNKYSSDLYGQARYLYNKNGTQLRLDTVLQATEQVLTSMIANEQASKQYSVGLFQFNTDVSVLTTGTQGTTGDTYGDVSNEATYNLPGVLQAVYGIDYTHAKETTFPPIDTTDDGNTNFGTSMNDLFKGNATGGTAIGAAGNGNAAATPLKDLFIVTDGMEDECCTPARVMGEMTSYTQENGPSVIKNLALCGQYKNLGFDVYVLYINYNPVPTISYYEPYSAGYSSPSDAYLGQDYPAAINTTERNYTLSAATTGLTPVTTTPTSATDSPNEYALRACSGPGKNTSASTAATITYFNTATDGPSIATALSNMLQSAIGTSIRVTQ
jgi:Flp pilus assembly protein TadG